MTEREGGVQCDRSNMDQRGKQVSKRTNHREKKINKTA